MRILRRFWPVLLLIAILAAAWAAGLPQHLTWETLARNQDWLKSLVVENPRLSPILYVAGYILAAALSLPEAAVITVAGGLLFGTALGGLLALIGSTAGATVLFLAVRYHLADGEAVRANGLLGRIRPRLERDGFLYLLAIRLVPVFPFWLVNLAAALCGMRVLPFIAATLVGSLPATMIYAWIGSGLADVLAAGGRPDLGVIFSPRLLGPLLLLACLSLLPLAWRKWKGSDA